MPYLSNKLFTSPNNIQSETCNADGKVRNSYSNSFGISGVCSSVVEHSWLKREDPGSDPGRRTTIFPTLPSVRVMSVFRSTLTTAAVPSWDRESGGPVDQPRIEKVNTTLYLSLHQVTSFKSPLWLDFFQKYRFLTQVTFHS